MELWALQNIAEGIVSLAELEKQNSILGKDLNSFVLTINRCCRDAYSRYSVCLDDVLTLPIEPTNAQRAAVQRKLREASNGEWFRDVARICDDLAALANTYDSGIKKHTIMSDNSESGKRHSLMMLLMILHKHEGDLKQDIRQSVDLLKQDIADSRISEARQLATTIKNEIDSNLTKINGVAVQITGSTSNGAHELLKSKIAEDALRKPERVLIFNGAMVAILLIVGATVMQYVSLIEFPLLTGFVLTAIIVINAFYLRSIDMLREEPFMELVKLALLKFFAPLSRPVDKHRSSQN